MTDPVILNAEAFRTWPGFGSALASKYYPTAASFPANNSRPQFGRGVGPQGYCTRGNSGCSWGFPLVTPTATIGQAVAFSQGGSVGGSAILEFWDGYDLSTAKRHLALYTDSTGHIVAARDVGGSLAVLGTSTNRVPMGSGSSVPGYVHVEVCCTIDGSTGTVHVKVDGTDTGWLNLTGQNTKAAGGASTVAVALIGTQQGDHATGARCYTDWLVHDGSNFIGDVRVAYFASAAGGTYTDGVLVGAGTRVLAVSDTIAESNEDVDYLSFPNVSLPKAATFTPEALPSSATAVKAVIPLVIVRKTDAGTNLGRQVVKSGATEDDGGVDVIVPGNWVAWERIYQTDPNTSAAWTIGNANAVEVGFRRTA